MCELRFVHRLEPSAAEQARARVEVYRDAVRAWHAGLAVDAVERSVRASEALDEHTRELVSAMVEGYVWYWQHDALAHVLTTEAGVRVVKLDDGRLAVHRVEVSTRSIGSAAVYWRREMLRAEIARDVEEARALDLDVSGALVDVTRWLGLEPKRPTDATSENADLTRAGTLARRGRRVKAETPGEYFVRALDTFRGRPADFLVRSYVPVDDARIEAGAREREAVESMVATFRERGVWPRNVQRCAQDGNVCEYLTICGLEIGEHVPAGFRRVSHDL